MPVAGRPVVYIGDQPEEAAPLYAPSGEMLSSNRLVEPPMEPEQQGVASRMVNRLLGTQFGEPRYQTWPEQMVRSAATLPGDVVSGAEPTWDEEGRTSPRLVERTQDLAGLAMSGGVAGTGKGGVALGSGPVRSAPVPEKHGPVWHSPVENALEQSTTGRATGAQWLATLRNSRGVKPEELDWTGLSAWLAERADKPVTRPELHDYLRDNRVELQDVTKKAVQEGHPDFNRMVDEKMRENPGRMRSWAEDEVYAALQGPGGEPKYHSYQLPGGENYREHLITMPAARAALDERAGLLYRGLSYDQLPETYKNIVRDEVARDSGYRSSHWDEPNIIAHVRSNVRNMETTSIPEIEAKIVAGVRGTNLEHMASGMPARLVREGILTPQEAADWSRSRNFRNEFSDKPGTGRKSLHLEEVQSDWHQTGRKKGYKGQLPKVPEDIQALTDKMLPNQAGRDPRTIGPVTVDANIGGSLTAEEANKLLRWMRENREEPALAVPDAPWKKTWHELALKRMIRQAAEEGIDRISWTPGEAQAARYGLSKQVQALDLTHNRDGVGELLIYPKNGGVQRRAIKSEQDLIDTVGKDMADKLYKQGKENNGRAKLEGVDLKIGGEGMRGFYDKMMVQAAEKIGREHGVKVKKGSIPGNSRVRGGDTHNVPPSEIYQELPELRAEYPNRVDFVEHYNGLNREQRAALVEKARAAGKQPVWYFDIPPSMRETALQRGMPLFSGGQMFMPSAAKERDQ